MHDDFDADRAELAERLIAERGGREVPEWTWLARVDPEFMDAYGRLTQKAMGFYHDRDEPPATALSVKMKELIGIALLAARVDAERMPLHMARALDHGATDLEVVEALEVSMVFSGGLGLRLGIEQLLLARRRRGEPVGYPMPVPIVEEPNGD